MRTSTPAILALLFLTTIACSSSSTPSTSPTGSSSGGATTPDGGTSSSSSSSSGSSSSGGSTTTTPASGTVAGHAFKFAYGIATPATVNDPETAGYEIFLSDKPIDCESVTLEGATTVDIDVAGTPPAKGSYTAIESYDVSAHDGQVSADFNAEDATCGMLTSDSSVSGTVILTASDGVTIEGSLDVMFESNARVKEGSVAGTFKAVVCAKFPMPACTPH